MKEKIFLSKTPPFMPLQYQLLYLNPFGFVPSVIHMYVPEPTRPMIRQVIANTFGQASK